MHFPRAQKSAPLAFGSRTTHVRQKSILNLVLELKGTRPLIPRDCFDGYFYLFSAVGPVCSGLSAAQFRERIKPG